MSFSPRLSVVLCTFNRAAVLPRALAALAAQETGSPPYELVIVNNGSTDDTPEVLQRFVESHQSAESAGRFRIRCVTELRQGLSYARNTGVAHAGTGLLAFTDDDVEVAPSWVRRLVQAFDGHPDAQWLGGKVTGKWEQPPPGWLSRVSFAPLALIDYGPDSFTVDPGRSVCLIGSNFALRRSTLDRVGAFSSHVQRVRDGVGSTEDYELQRRMLDAGFTGRYEPDIEVKCAVPAERISKRYYRRWHRGHGRFYALMRDPEFEPTRAGTFLGLPAHVVRSAAREFGSWMRHLFRLRPDEAFEHELRLWFLMAFARQRLLQRP